MELDLRGTSVTFHPTQVNTWYTTHPTLTPATQSGTRLTYRGGIEG